MDHPMAVGAEQRQILDRPRLLAANVQRLDVVALDIPLAPRAVLLGEVEPADLAGKRSTDGQDAVDLFLAQAAIPSRYACRRRR